MKLFDIIQKLNEDIFSLKEKLEVKTKIVDTLEKFYDLAKNNSFFKVNELDLDLNEDLKENNINFKKLFSILYSKNKVSGVLTAEDFFDIFHNKERMIIHDCSFCKRDISNIRFNIEEFDEENSTFTISMSCIGCGNTETMVLHFDNMEEEVEKLIYNWNY